MIVHGSLAALDHLERAAVDVLAWRVDDIDDDLDGLALRWLRVDHLARELAVLARDFATNVGGKLSDMPYDPRAGYQLPNGERVHHAVRSTDRWRGRQLLTDLGAPMIDPDTGEHVHAIPVEILEQIIPGTRTDEQTSSSWGVRGLQNLGIDPDDYRTREWQQPLARPGRRTG